MSDPKSRRFAFLIHPRSLADIRGKFSVLSYVPGFVLERLMKFMPPMHVANITGVVADDGVPLVGELVAVPFTAKEMLRNRQAARKKVLKALKYCKKINATHVGLGAYTSVVTDGGLWLQKQIPGIHITNGNALTAVMSYRGLRMARQKRGCNGNVTIAVIGATGSIGSAVTKLIAEADDFKELLIVGRTLEHTEDLMGTLERYNNAEKIKIASIDEAVPSADIIFLATSASDVLITPKMLKKNACVYDISQPKNVCKTIVKERPDVMVVDGGLSKLPEGYSYGHDFGIPHNTMFSCMAETILLARAQHDDDFCLGHVTKTHVDQIAALANKYKLLPAVVLLSKSK